MKHEAIESLKNFAEHIEKIWNDPAFQAELKRKAAQWEQEIADAKYTLQPLIKVGDLIRVQDCHHSQPCTYEVSSIESNGPVSQPGHFAHNWVDIIAVYRFDDIAYMYNLIWRK